MLSRTLRFASFSVGLFALFLLVLSSAPSASADASHIRIIRISYVQGDVRFARDVKGDPLAGAENITWENAELNLPIRQGFVISTEHGRAEVEFENGSLALIGENTVLQFFDLSLEDGSKTTRLILRQGTASFSINPGNGDYFSVTGGDFSVEADGHSTFRLDNFDDGSRVNVMKGRVNVLRKKGSTELAKGQTFSMKASDPKNFDVASINSQGDDFDKWTSGRIDSENNGTAAAQQYVNSPNYTSGLSSLYDYGAFYPCQFGNCWRPYGVGLGWSPFDSGSFYSDPWLGTSFIGNQPWGWLPYHYGGWLFDPTFGWLWSPNSFGGSGLYGGYPGYLPVNGTWLRNGKGNGPIGIVPTHPLDAKAKTPTNLAQGVFPVSNGAISRLTPVASGQEWKSVKSVPTNTVNTRVSIASAPVRTERTMAGGNAAARSVSLGNGASLSYDAASRRFVNSSATAATNARVGAMTAVPASASSTRLTNLSARPTAAPARNFAMAARSVPPPSAPRSGFVAGRTGGNSSGGNTSGRSGGFSAASASSSSSHASASSSGSSSGARSH
jgi:ferric-dicitrate binding protein FerR (iron transport regulator)